MKIIISASLLFICAQVHAQDYLVLLKGDTLYGTISILPQNQLDRVQVKNETGRHSYTAHLVSSVKKEGLEFRPVRIDNRIEFMQVLIKGYLTLYAFRTTSPSLYDGQFFVKLGGQSLELPNIAFKKTVSDFLADCPEIARGLETGTYSKKNIEILVADYNQCIQKANKAYDLPPTTDSNNSPQVANAEALLQRVRTSGMTNQSDVEDILTDIIEKLKNGKVIPHYLRTALQEHAKIDTRIFEQATLFLANLPTQ